MEEQKFPQKEAHITNIYTMLSFISMYSKKNERVNVKDYYKMI